MNRLVNTISNRMSLRSPQRKSLEILDRITEIIKLGKNTDLQQDLATIEREFPSVSDFERDFPSMCFALATGVGKTRLMGAFISYMYLVHGKSNFMVLAPNLTIYNKLIADFTPNTPKYVFAGIAEFAQEPPLIITGDNYEDGVGVRDDYNYSVQGIGTDLVGQTVAFRDVGAVHINIFNISKINSEVRGGKSPRIKRFKEYIGQSYFEYLSNVGDLVLIMDESHRYRATAGLKSINELKPILGLELTATPYVETGKGPVAFRNIIYEYNLAKAMEDGFVKEPAVATQRNFIAHNFSKDQLEEIKLKDGIRLHENTKVELATYHHETGQPLVKPFMLIIARDTTHAGQLIKKIHSDDFFEGQYKDKVIQVDSSKSGAEEDEMITRLLAVERTDEPTEIVIHVNMLKEGWDVTNLYTIVPLRAANARVLIEQSIGRGLRLPYGKRTGISAIDRLSIVAHDKFQEIIDEANRADSPVHLTQIYLDNKTNLAKTKTVISPSNVARLLQSPVFGLPADNTMFTKESEKAIAKIVYKVIIENEKLPNSRKLMDVAVQVKIAEKVQEYLMPSQLEIPGLEAIADIKKIVKQATEIYVDQIIDIPRIVVMPKGEVKVGYHQFKLDCSSVHYQPVERDILLQHLRTQKREVIGYINSGYQENRLEDYLIRGLMNFNDICYDEQSELLYDLAGQMVKHLGSYLNDKDDISNVIQYYQKQLVELIHSQMQQQQWEKASDYEVTVTKGFTELKQSAYTVREDEAVLDFHQAVKDKNRIGQMLFGNFKHCLYEVQKFDSDPERKLAVILDRETLKWFRPAKGQFQIFYKTGLDPQEYIPDFVAETDDCILMLEPKASNQMETPEVLAKKEAAETWCKNASEHNQKNGGKPWEYMLISHDVISDSMTLEGIRRI